MVTMSKDELRVLQSSVDLGRLNTMTGKETDDVRYVLASDEHNSYVVVERKTDGEWMYGERIHKDQISRYAKAN